MLIAFDGACLADGPVTGVGRAFVDGLAAYAARGEHECVLLLPAGANDPALANVRTAAAPRGGLRRQLALPRLLRALGASVLHSSVAAVPLRARCPTIATVHDLPWLHPEVGEPGTRWRRAVTRWSLRAAAAVLAPSAITRDDAARVLGGAAKVHVVPHGTSLGPAPDEAAVRARAGAFLVLGDDRPRKNRDRVRAAHARARTHAADIPPLRFVGPPNDYVSEDEKRRLLAHCRALVHASLFEGFGLPVLEGLAHGAPVLCSDLPPHREIARDHALFADPRDETALADAFVRVHRDDALRWRLARGGHARAAELSPAAVAEHWARVHREVRA